MPDGRRPTAEDYERARQALREISLVGGALADLRYRQIVDVVWPVAFAAGWAACLDGHDDSDTGSSAASGGQG